METLKDGKDGFNSAAELLEDNSRSELASQFREFSQQRGRFYQQRFSPPSRGSPSQPPTLANLSLPSTSSSPRRVNHPLDEELEGVQERHDSWPI